MSWYSRGWAPYVPVAQRQRMAAQEIARLRKAGKTITPVQIAGQKIATTVWGKAWCDNLESYHDYENRLPRGRAYVRGGSVIDLQMTPSRVQALVSGSDIYRVTVAIAAVPKEAWQSICADCTGRIESLIELLQGRLSKAVMERLCRQKGGLFPKPSEIQFTCSCPDHAAMCKHVAAVLYGVGARLDSQPDLLFRLRDVDETALIANIKTTIPALSNTPVSDRVLEDDDVAALFGIDMAALDAPDDKKAGAIAKKPGPVRGRKSVSQARSKTVTGKGAPKLGANDKAASAVQSRPSKSAAKAKVDRTPADKPIKWWLKPKQSTQTKSRR